MSANGTQPVQGDLERLEAELRAAQAEALHHSEQFAEHERLAMEHRKAHREAYERAGRLRGELTFAKRIADGYCAKLVYDRDYWRHTGSPCKNKAKPGSTFCGVHNRV